jgi:hypothetical protein
MSELLCLRCKTVPLVEAEPIGGEVAFFECAVCRRQYALKPDRGLTFRWLHPISLALYSVQFETSPVDRAADVTAALIRQRPAERLESFAREIRLELDEPTQQVRDILDCTASEEELREFLRLVADGIEEFLTAREGEV